MLVHLECGFVCLIGLVWFLCQCYHFLVWIKQSVWLVVLEFLLRFRYKLDAVEFLC